MTTHGRGRRIAAAAAFSIVAGGLSACDPDRSTQLADADNTARNVGDRDGRAVTPMDQGASEGDRTITQQIRRRVTANDTLSADAHNVKIVTQDGVVTLRGPVETAEEKAAVLAAAQAAPGVTRVDDQLEVKATN